MDNKQINLLKIEPSKVAIICGDKASWRETYAAEELKKYLQLMSDADVSVITDGETVASDNVLLIGENLITRGLLDKGWLRSPEELSSTDGFIMMSVKEQDRCYLVLWGKKDIGTLYAVYHYLAACCGVGFFRDWEQVPKRKQIPFHPISVTEEPRFADRSVVTMHYGLGLKKYQSGFWSAEEWMSFYSWIAKAKCNMTNSILGHLDWGTEAAYRACADIGMPIERRQRELPIRHVNDWPQSWTQRMEYQSATVRKIQEYGRKLGVRLPYSFSFGDVPF